METCMVRRSKGKTLRFKGELLAEVRSTPDQGSSRYSGSVGRWETYQLFRTSGGNYVGVKVHHTAWQGEKGWTEAELLKSQGEVFEFFGDDWLAQRLYQEASLEYVEDVD